MYLEIAHTLDTDFFLNAFQRFISRRGLPEKRWSDNGTNFIGADRELRQAIQSLGNIRVHEFMTHRCIEWQFNPPAASHMGRVWEHLLRSVRKVLTSFANQSTLTAETLHTFMCPVENTVNSRLLYTLSDDLRYVNSLTPNHLIQPRITKIMLFGTFDSKDMYVRHRWKQCQYLAYLF